MKKKYNAPVPLTVLFDIVKQRPLVYEKPLDAPVCPYCDSDEVRMGSKCTTLVGGWCNHVWQRLECLECKMVCVREYKEHGKEPDGNVWYTEGRHAKHDRDPSKPPRVLLGVPSCFEDYLYDCAKCGKEGAVSREHLKLHSWEPVDVLVRTIGDGKSVKQYHTTYSCSKCGHGGFVEEDYWRPDAV